MPNQISYTFPAATAHPLVRGKTFSGGVFSRSQISGKLVDVVDFGPQSFWAGHHLICVIAGKPELEAAFAAHVAAANPQTQIEASAELQPKIDVAKNRTRRAKKIQGSEPE